MFVYGKIFLGLIISFFAFACTLEPVCQKEEAIECLRVPEEGVDHRICRGGEWLDAQCRISEVCLENSCVFLTEDCNENNKRCLTSRHVEVCTASSKAKVELCEEGFVCDEKACAQGEDCCVAIKTCSETVKQCLNLKTVEVCEASSMAQIVTCEEGFICDDNACAQGKDCCVASTTCGKTYDSCSDEDTVMVCVEGAYPIVKSCELGEICKRGQCVEDVCRNHRFDLGEEAIDCGGSCAPCKTCQSDADCGKQGFCDSAFNHLCSKRCRKDSDCAQSELWDGEFCRNDGRCSPKVFETQWELTGTDLSIVLPFDPEYPSGKCDFQILWGDEAAGVDVTSLPHVTDCLVPQKHSYKKAGVYHVKIIGVYDGWGAFDKINTINGTTLTPAASKLRSVVSFGPVGLSKGAFHGASKLSLMPKRDIPDATKLYSLDSAFYLAMSFNGAIGHWDTSEVTSMGKAFFNAESFNQPIGAWDTSKVLDMNNMFCSATAFNQDIGDWDTSQVQDMRGMFSGASSFNQAIGRWNVEQVSDMEIMFQKAVAFNQPIDQWKLTNVLYMYGMFLGASVFNQPIGQWNVFNVIGMEDMFKSASAFDQDLSNWDLRSEVVLSNIFADSGMSVAHLCALKAKEGAWLAQWAKLGKSAVCP